MKVVAVAVLAALMAAGGCSTWPGRRAGLVQTPSNCADQTVQIYFEPNSADLTPESRSVIDVAAGNLRVCKVHAVEVLGLADAAGDPRANLELSRRRAQAVSHALAAAGLPAAEFRIAAAGQAGAISANGEVAPVRRRVDVILRASR